MRKNEEATVAMLANSSDDQLLSQSLHQKIQVIAIKRLFVFGLAEFFFFSNEC